MSAHSGATGRRPAPRKKMPLAAKAEFVQQHLALRYPTPQTHLNAANPWELLVATVLSAQCTDARVNMITPALFARWKTPEDLARADIAEVETYIRSTGFYRNKAKNIVGAANALVSRFGGAVPQAMADLLTLPGVARKTANVVLWGSFGINEGIAVDTHVERIAFRLGFASGHNPAVTERELMELFPREQWGDLNHRLVWFGRQVCDARSPRCGECELEPVCDKNGLRLKKESQGDMA